jgi:phosphatidylglycerophosphate synthase
MTGRAAAVCPDLLITRVRSVRWAVGVVAKDDTHCAWWVAVRSLRHIRISFSRCIMVSAGGLHGVNCAVAHVAKKLGSPPLVNGAAWS